MFRKKKSKKAPCDIPRDLEALGYKIDEKNQLVSIEDGEIYKFEVKDRAYNERLYDIIMELLASWVEEKLQKDLGFIKKILPLGATENDIHTKIFLTPDYETNDKMIIFIPGTAHSVGIWSRRALIDISVIDGSMINYAKRALDLGFSVVMLNPNEVFWYKGKGSESPEAHTSYVFENIVIPSAAQKIFIIANSYGGHCAIDVMQNHINELSERVKAIEFTVSAHSIDFVKTDRMKVWIREHCRNWLMSDLPIGEEIIDTRFGCHSFSSGSELIEYITYAVIDLVFKFIENKLINPENFQDDTCDTDDDLLISESQHIFDTLVSNVQGTKYDFDDNENGRIVEETDGSAWLSN
ncbi:23632_t:CDS:10 [Dentiscutata erythropus]|uniref:23632_t:CDS:1 n=1 Tax=Dentiscutata erythropus TaxID=1348616 RepID=A0A9N9EJ99_9GLOM|nr:23632_t:CDS:10 [Dentiscutata erythropus]